MRRSVWLIGLLVVALTFAGCLGGSAGFRLTIKEEGEGRVIVTPQKGTYRRNEAVTLVAEPAEGWIFAGWEGALSGNNPEERLVVTGSMVVKAVFTTPDRVPADRGVVRGVVSDGQGGPAVKGATVTWNDAYKTTTNDEGEFVLFIPAGEAGDLLVERPDNGFTKVQALQVKAGEEKVLDIPTRRAFSPYASLTPPTVELNIEPGQILSGVVDVHVKVSGENDTYVVYAYVGGEQRSPREEWALEVDELEFSVDTRQYPNGQAYIRILAYDSNENTVIYIVPVTIYNQAPWQVSPPGIVPLVEVWADTYAENIGYYSKGAVLEMQKRQNRLAPPDMAQLEAVPDDSVLMVFITWLEADGADGYKVYRSFDAVHYHQISTVSNKHLSRGLFQVVDYSPQLAPGNRTWYKVVPYNSAGEGPGTVVDVTPLPPMDIWLVSPANGETDVELMPTFKWELRARDQFPEDAYIEYLLWVFDATYWQVVEEFVYGVEEYTLDLPLKPGHVYTWDIADAYAEHWQTDGPTGYSVATSRGGLQLGDTDTGSRNGEFIFTTTTEIEE